MSGGQCQRVMIAMAIACNPKLLIADEPTTALDVTIQKQILDLLLGLQAENGMALMLITHDMGVVAETADRVIVQYNGRKMEETDVALALRARRRTPTPARCSRRCPENATGGRLPTVADYHAARRRRRERPRPVLETRGITRDYRHRRRHVRRPRARCTRVKGDRLHGRAGQDAGGRRRIAAAASRPWRGSSP